MKGGEAMNIETYLQHGEENAIFAYELARLLGVSNRDLRRIIDRARENGALILCSDRGYFFPSEDSERATAELKRFCNMMNRRAKHSAQVIRHARRELESIGGLTNG